MNVYPRGVQVPSEAYGWPLIPMAGAAKIIALTQSLIDARFVYESGTGVGKIIPISLQASQVPIGKRSIDCSGLVAWALYHSSSIRLPDGSVYQHAWVKQVGFKHSMYVDGFLDDGAVRIAFLSPEAAVLAGLSREERHVMLVTGGWTCESHGGRGPDRRKWGSERWMAFCELYVLWPGSEVTA